MIGEGVICAVFGGLWTVMVAVSIRNVCGAGGVVSFSGVVGLLGGIDLVVVVGGIVAAAGWRGHSPAEGAGCLLLSALFLYLLVGSTLWKVSSTQTRSFPSDILHSGEPTKVYSFKAFIRMIGSMVIRWLVVNTSGEKWGLSEYIAMFS